MAGVVAGQWFLYMLNRARHDPAAYQREQSLSADLSNVAPRQPLAFSDLLRASSQFHSDEMAEHNYFDHQSAVTGQWPNANARDFGYPLPDSWANDKNNIESIAAGYSDARTALNGLLESQGHRNHLLGVSSFFAANIEGGVGYAKDTSAAFTHYWSVHLARRTKPQVFLTGVVFDDLNDNGTYDPGEGSPGIRVSLPDRETLTNEAGGWSLIASRDTTNKLKWHGPFGERAILVDVADQNREVDARIDSMTAQVDFGDWVSLRDGTEPSAELQASELRLRRVQRHPFTVIYRDDQALDPTTLATGNLRVNGPNGFSTLAEFDSWTLSQGQWLATYQLVANHGAWTSADNGTYSVRILADQVRDLAGNSVPASTLGSFEIQISSESQREDVNDDGIVAAIDALIVVNYLNNERASVDPELRIRMDVDRDQLIAPLDVVIIVNYLNRIGSGEGEAPRFGSFAASTDEPGVFDEDEAFWSSLASDFVELRRRRSWSRCL
jgi:hypothetical protein